MTSARTLPDCLVVEPAIARACAALFIQQTGAMVAVADPGIEALPVEGLEERRRMDIACG